MAGLEGVRMGPQDPDSTADFGQVSGQNSALELIRRHGEQHTDTGIHGRKLDSPRSDIILDHLDTVSEIAGVDAVGAGVRGTTAAQRVVTFTYYVDSGRSVKGWFPFEELPEWLQEACETNFELAEARRRGQTIVQLPAGTAQAAADGSSVASVSPADLDEIRDAVADLKSDLADERELREKAEQDAEAARAEADEAKAAQAEAERRLDEAAAGEGTEAGAQEASGDGAAADPPKPADPKPAAKKPAARKPASS